MTTKTFARDLLEQATFLSSREPRRPKEASLRRAVSTAYYALFHHVCSVGVDLLAPNVSKPAQHVIMRWFDHAAMKIACGRFLHVPLQEPLNQLVGTSASANLRKITRAFISLQEARHRADYDMSWKVTRTQAQTLIEAAREAMDSWSQIWKSPEANVFVLSVFHWKQMERPRP